VSSQRNHNWLKEDGEKLAPKRGLVDDDSVANLAYAIPKLEIQIRSLAASDRNRMRR
jgi:hypothetical protein